MEYDGFALPLLDRIERLLDPSSRAARSSKAASGHDELSVTRLLLLMSAGFVMVFERLKAMKQQDGQSVEAAKAFLDSLGGGSLSAAAVLEDGPAFTRFHANTGWRIIKHECDPEPPVSLEYLARVVNGDGGDRRDDPVDCLLGILRNSIAHGNVWLMSPSQAKRYGLPPRVAGDTGGSHCDSHHIDRVYFVSKWKGRDDARSGNAPPSCGYRIAELSVDALRDFWLDWRSLVTRPGGPLRNALEQTETVAA